MKVFLTEQVERYGIRQIEAAADTEDPHKVWFVHQGEVFYATGDSWHYTESSAMAYVERMVKFYSSKTHFPEATLRQLAKQAGWFDVRDCTKEITAFVAVDVLV